MKIVGKFQGKISEKDVINTLKLCINPFIEHNYYGKTVLDILRANNVHFAHFLNSLPGNKGSFFIKSFIDFPFLFFTIKGEGECKECGGEYEIYDFREEGEDELSMKITKLHQRCIICGNVRTIKIEDYERTK